MTVQKTLKTNKEQELIYIENPDITQNLKSQNKPYCKLCGSGYRTNLEGDKFCPNQKSDCPLLTN